jgi:hypothetical protein
LANEVSIPVPLRSDVVAIAGPPVAENEDEADAVVGMHP